MDSEIVSVARHYNFGTCEPRLDFDLKAAIGQLLI